MRCPGHARSEVRGGFAMGDECINDERDTSRNRASSQLRPRARRAATARSRPPSEHTKHRAPVRWTKRGSPAQMPWRAAYGAGTWEGGGRNSPVTLRGESGDLTTHDSLLPGLSDGGSARALTALTCLIDLRGQPSEACYGHEKYSRHSRRSSSLPL